MGTFLLYHTSLRCRYGAGQFGKTLLLFSPISLITSSSLILSRQQLNMQTFTAPPNLCSRKLSSGESTQEHKHAGEESLNDNKKIKQLGSALTAWWCTGWAGALSALLPFWAVSPRPCRDRGKAGTLTGCAPPLFSHKNNCKYGIAEKWRTDSMKMSVRNSVVKNVNHCSLLRTWPVSLSIFKVKLSGLGHRKVS